MAAIVSYDTSQIQAFFDRIKLPSQLRKRTVSGLSPEDALSFLKTLQKHNLVAIPFENLNLHYGRSGISLRPDDLYHKIVESKGRGGYCMENNFIFGTVLRSLGYQLYPTGARVCEGAPSYNGW
jgi:arylamine N-acetyltransferase